MPLTQQKICKACKKEISNSEKFIYRDKANFEGQEPPFKWTNTTEYLCEACALKQGIEND